MSKKGRVKIKKTEIGDEDISVIFNQLIGAGDLDPNVVLPKIMAMQNLAVFVVSEANSLKNILDKYDNYKTEIEECKKYIINAVNYLDKEFKLDTDNLTTRYGNIKSSELLLSIVEMCNNLFEYKKHFDNKQELDHKFIDNMSGVSWTPLTFTQLNIKQLYIDLSDEDRNALINVIHNIFTRSYELFNLLQSPDIDVDKFIDIIMRGLDKLKTVPELSRCDLAFNKMRGSVGLFKENFNNYYRDFVETSNSNIILEHFIIDVGLKSSSDTQSPVMVGQFHKIVSYYQKAQQQSNTTSNPQMKVLFDKLNESFAAFNKVSSNITKK